MIMNEMNLEAWRHLLKPISSDGDGGNRLAQALNDYDPATGAPGNNGRLPSDPGIGFANRQDQPQRGDQYATYVGEGAKGIDKDALQLAKQQQSSGGTRYDIWRNTGWTQGKDNKWRSEVDDSGATLHQSFNPSVEPGRSRRFTLGNVLNHDKLFAAYPHLRDMPVQVMNAPKASYRGQYDPKEKAITLNSGTDGAGMDTLLHEVQHAVQYHEGFRYGSFAAQHKDRPGEIEAHDTAGRATLNAAQRRAWSPELKASVTTENSPHPAQLNPRQAAIWRSAIDRPPPPLLRRDPNDAFPVDSNNAPYRGADYGKYRRGYLERSEPGSSDQNFRPCNDDGSDNPHFDQYLSDGRPNPRFDPETDLKGRPFGRNKTR
jgi:hypothetical protein